jgi:hypothetical protein
MPCFRARNPRAQPQPISPDAIAVLIEEALAPAHFFVGPSLELECVHNPAEECSWEVFHGRLLDPAHTRQRRGFASWNVYLVLVEGRAPEPFLSVKWDARAGQLHVVRGLDSYAWEGYDAGGGVFLSRECRKWVRELTGTIRMDCFADLEELRDELMCRLFLAVIGSSRLPLASVEAPLPAFSLGELFYCYRPDAAVTDGWLRGYAELVARMLGPALARRERARLLETFLHAVPPAEMPQATRLWVRRWRELGGTSADLAALLRTLYNDVSLSPYTDLADKTLAFLGALEEAGYFQAADTADFLGHLLRKLGRHLTAYDLITFHHRGANYPDALLLDAVLGAYLDLIEREPGLFAATPGENDAEDRKARLRRRALRQGYLLRRQYEGHPVPDQPTSPGENSRVLPGQDRVPEEQILQPARRRRRLYAADPLPRHLGPRAQVALRQSFDDLAHFEERRELGMGLFIDRPLGGGKHPAEPDGTLLLASVAFSRSVALQRLRNLAAEIGLAEDSAEVEAVRRGLEVAGLPLEAIGPAARPGSVTLADAAKASPDFVFLWTTRSGVGALLRQFDFTPLGERFDLDYLTGGAPVLVARSPQGPSVRIHDDAWRPRLELEVPVERGYESRGGGEYPAGGLLAVRAWVPLPGGELEEHDLRGEPLRVPLR